MKKVTPAKPRASLYTDIIRSNLPVVSERSLLSNVATFISKLEDDREIGSLDFCLLREKSTHLFDLLCEQFALKPFFIYLKDTPERALKRIKNRGREGEEEISLEFLSDLQRRYDEFYSSFDKYPTAIIDLGEYSKQDGSIDFDQALKRIFIEFFGHFATVYLSFKND